MFRLRTNYARIFYKCGKIVKFQSVILFAIQKKISLQKRNTFFEVFKEFRRPQFSSVKNDQKKPEMMQHQESLRPPQLCLIR